jgi:hypothetical protein
VDVSRFAEPDRFWRPGAFAFSRSRALDENELARRQERAALPRFPLFIHRYKYE